MHLCLSERELVVLQLDDAMIPDLTSLDLSGNNLGKHSLGRHVKDQLLSIISRAPKLLAINISNNLFPPEILIELHSDINLLNIKGRDPTLLLMSDFSYLDPYTPNPTAAQIQERLLSISTWFLSRWKFTEVPLCGMKILNEVLTNATASERDDLWRTLLQQVNTKNTNGDTLLTAAIQLRQVAIAEIFFTRMGEDAYFATAAAQGSLFAKAKLALLYENQGNILNVYRVIKPLHDALNETPTRADEIPSELLEKVEKRYDFLVSLSDMVKILIKTRVARAKERCIHNLPAYRIFNERRVHAELNGVVSRPAWIKILSDQETALLLKSYLSDTLRFSLLQTHLEEQLNREALGQGLLSIDPDQFSAAFIHAVQDFKRLQLRLVSGRASPINNGNFM